MIHLDDDDDEEENKDHELGTQRTEEARMMQVVERGGGEGGCYDSKDTCLSSRVRTTVQLSATETFAVFNLSFLLFRSRLSRLHMIKPPRGGVTGSETTTSTARSNFQDGGAALRPPPGRELLRPTLG